MYIGSIPNVLESILSRRLVFLRNNWWCERSRVNEVTTHSSYCKLRKRKSVFENWNLYYLNITPTITLLQWSMPYPRVTFPWSAGWSALSHLISARSSSGWSCQKRAQFTTLRASRLFMWLAYSSCWLMATWSWLLLFAPHRTTCCIKMTAETDSWKRER